MNSPDAWEAALETMITNLAVRQEQAKAYRPIAEQWFADSQAPMFRQLFETIIRDTHEKFGQLPGVYYV